MNPSLPQPGEIPLKAWLLAEAQRTGLKFHTIYMRFYRGAYWKLETRRVNARVTYVKAEK